MKPEIKKAILSICAFHCLFPIYSHGDAKVKFAPRNYTIEFSDEGTLTDIYNAGLRPYRFPGLERTTLEFKNCITSFVLDDGKKTPPLPTELADIAVLEGGLLATINIRSISLSLPDARKLIGEFLPLGSKSESQLDQLLEAVADNYMTYSDPPSKHSDGFNLSWPVVKGPKYNLKIYPTYNKDRPISLALNINWSQLRPGAVMRQ